jgi:hypothetical protein
MTHSNKAAPGCAKAAFGAAQFVGRVVPDGGKHPVETIMSC